MGYWRWTISCLLLALLVGCGKKPATQPAGTLTLQQITEDVAASIGAENPKDPKPEVPIIVYLDIFQLDVPLGTISGNEEFWKRINEQCVDVSTYDLLYKNGVRVGQAPIAEWAFFKEIIDQNPTRVRQMTASANDPKGIELEIKKGLREQTLAWWYAAGEPAAMRSYDRCDNLMAVSFVPTPRKLGHVRVTMCPIIRSVRKHFVITARTPDGPEIEYLAPERLYDLNLSSDVPPGAFLVVAPSSEAKWNFSLGRAFLIADGATERLEQVLLIVPRPYQVETDHTAAAK